MQTLFRKALVGSLLLLLLPAGVSLAPAQQPMDGETLYLIRRYQTLAGLITAGKNSEAAKVVEEVIPNFERNKEKDKAFSSALEFCYYARGLIALQSGNYPKATGYFQAYLQRYKRGPRIHLAKLMLADCYATQSKWSETVTLCREIENDERLKIRERLAIRQLLAEALLNQDKWKEAIPPLLYLYQKDPNWEIHVDSAVSLTLCLVRLGQFDKLYKWVPQVYDTPARFDIDLNIALIEEGDGQYKEQHYQEALLLYRLVFSKKELTSQIQERIEEAQAKAKRPLTGATDEQLRAAGATKRRYQRAAARFKAQLSAIKAFPEYDSKIALRLATSYFDLERYPNALQAYRTIYQEFKGQKVAERAMFSAYSTALKMEDDTVALAEAKQYIETFPSGEFFDDLTVSVVQRHMENDEPAEAVEMARLALDVSPNHKLKPQMVYFIGYNLFQVEQLPEAIAIFDRVLNDFPDSGFEQAAKYWRAMAHLFLSEYAIAEAEFVSFLDEYGGGPYAQDVLYRLGVAQYGQGDFAAATATFNRCLNAFPGGSQAPDIYGMLGDIYAADGLLDEAIDSYDQMAGDSDSLVQINYSVFQKARTYELEQRYDEIIALFREYIEEWGEQGNFTEAYYWIGTSLHKQGDIPGSLNTFFDAIVAYGNNRKHYGIDMMIYDLIAEHPNMVGRPEYETFLERLYKEIGEARLTRRRTLSLRLRALFARTAETEAGRRQMGLSLVNEQHIPYAGPVTLVIMGEEARANGKDDLAGQVYEYFLTEFRDSDLILSALTGMAGLAIDQENYDVAIPLLEEIVARFPQMEDAGWAMTRLGNLYRVRGDYALAEEQLMTVLQVKEWRGEAWAESLYDLGLIYMDRYQTDKDKTQDMVDWATIQEDFEGISTYREYVLELLKRSHVYFQRVYVMYAGYPPWGARAYLKSAECLQILGRKDEAIATLKEFLGFPALTEGPEGDEAREMLKRLGDPPSPGSGGTSG